jgi:hypothetical protein
MMAIDVAAVKTTLDHNENRLRRNERTVESATAQMGDINLSLTVLKKCG